MKLAILISGEPRFCRPLEEHIENLKGYDEIDWYFYLWKETSHYRLDLPPLVPKSWENIPSSEWAFETIHNRMPKNNRIARCILGEDFKEFNSLAGQFTSLNRVDQLRQNLNKDYDLIFRSRIDHKVLEPIDLREIKEKIDVNPNLVVTPANFRHYAGKWGMCDHLAITSPQNMSIYTDLVNHIDRYVPEVPYHAEALLNYHLISNGLELEESIVHSRYPFDSTYWDQ